MAGEAALQWEQIGCPLCDDPVYDEVLCAPGADEQSFRLVRCRGCSMTYLNPRPDEASIGRYYPEDYEPYQPPAGSPSKANKKRGWRRWRERLFGGDRDSMANIPFEGGGRLLDYGCGSGWYANRMRERGWQVTGMDMSPHAVAKAQRHFGLEVIHGTLPHPAVAAESFDVITMGAVVEHLHWPRHVIGAAARALKPGGRLVISVPNIASWGYRVFGTAWWPLELPRHLLHFTPTTLRLLVEMSELEEVELRMLGRTGWMRRSLAALRDKAPACDRKNSQSSDPTSAQALSHSHSPTRSRIQACLASLGRLRMMQSWLTRWTVWTGQADCLLLIARRPNRATSCEVQAA